MYGNNINNQNNCTSHIYNNSHNINTNMNKIVSPKKVNVNFNSPNKWK